MSPSTVTSLPVVTRLNQKWTMDFIEDRLVTRQKIRPFDVIDAFSRKGLASEVDTSFPGARVVQVLNRLADARRIIEAWCQDYKAVRPASALGYLTPEEFERLSLNGPGRRSLDLSARKLEADQVELEGDMPQRLVGRLPWCDSQLRIPCHHAQGLTPPPSGTSLGALEARYAVSPVPHGESPPGKVLPGVRLAPRSYLPKLWDPASTNG